MQQVLINNVSLDEFKDLLSDLIEEKFKETFKNSDINDSEQKYLSRFEVAKLLKISLPTLHNLTINGVLSGYRVGRRVLYKKAEVDSSLAVIESMKYKSNKS